MVAMRPWERVVFNHFETTETSLLSQYYNEIIQNYQITERRHHIEMKNKKQLHNASKEHATVILIKKKQWKRKAKELTNWMKMDKETLVDFYEEIIREILQPHTTSIPKDMISSVSAREERVNLLTISGPYVCEVDEDDYDSEDTDSSDEDDEDEDDDKDDKQTNPKKRKRN